MRKVCPEHPVLVSLRLRLRPFTFDDIKTVQSLVNDPEVATPLIATDYPYTEENARRWITKHQPGYEQGGGLNFAVEKKCDGELVGFIGMGGTKIHAGMGYWYGKSFWGNGYATEAGRVTLAFGFERLRLERVEASHLSGNNASGKVLQKMGMEFVGVKPYYYEKWDRHCDKDEYIIRHEDYSKIHDENEDLYSYTLI